MKITTPMTYEMGEHNENQTEKDMTNEEKFDDEYAKTGSEILASLKRVQMLITDFPADSSCGANWADLGSLTYVKSQIKDLEMFLTKQDEN